MDWNTETIGSPPPGRDPIGRARRTIATAALAIGLLVVGGTAVVWAADPPATPEPTATTQPADDGTTTAPGAATAPDAGTGTPPARGARGDCPDKGGAGGTGGGAGAAPGTTTPAPAPTTAPQSSPDPADV